MPELEIHHETEHAIDPMGQKVGVMAAVLAVALAIVSIASHRTHTDAIIHKSTANDKWAQYQAGRVKYHSLELGENLVTVFEAKGDKTDRMLADYARQKKKYEAEGKQIMGEARGADEASEADEHRALRFDFGEGLLEIALVVTSLYFISHKQMFPAIGLVAGVLGTAVAISGMMV
ncbi:MAG: DUF4337 domain-containing protein [Acidobacteriia bacterium]|nr:DUF4337 domain-containing protein [Terriglobia bacterium]